MRAQVIGVGEGKIEFLQRFRIVAILQVIVAELGVVSGEVRIDGRHLVQEFQAFRQMIGAQQIAGLCKKSFGVRQRPGRKILFGNFQG